MSQAFARLLVVLALIAGFPGGVGVSQHPVGDSSRLQIDLKDSTSLTGIIAEADSRYVYLRIRIGSTIVIRPIPRAAIASVRRVFRHHRPRRLRHRTMTDAQRASQALYDPDFAPRS